MNKKIASIIITVAFFIFNASLLSAQIPEGLGDRYIRVAEEGQITDTVSVWGDVGSSGRYIIPEGTSLPELISFSHGYTRLRGRDSNIKWSKKLIEVKVSRYKEGQGIVDITLFRYKFNEREPAGMFEFELQNNDIVSLQVARKPSFGDYVSVIAPVVGVIATSVLLIQNLQ